MKIRFLLRRAVLLSSPSRLLRAAAAAPGHARIIGGGKAGPDAFPYAVSLQDFLGRHFCGGSLIGRDVVLSAAHCDVGGALANVAVVGRHDLNSEDGETIVVASTLMHPEYDEDVTNNDFALLFLAEPVDEGAELVALNPDASFPTSGAPVQVAGWGRTDPEGFSASGELHAVEVNVLSNSKCEASQGRQWLYGSYYDRSYEGKITDSMLCGEAKGKDSCQGDSGGPLVSESSDGSADVQVGVVSWGYGCALEGLPGVYARVSSAYDWIREEVCRRSSHPPTGFRCEEFPTSSPTVSQAPSITSMPSVRPTTTLSPTATTHPTWSGCNTPGWVDSLGFGCDMYELLDSPGCPFMGDFEGTMGSANDNCCYCFGTGAPSPVPTYLPGVTRAPSTPNLFAPSNEGGWALPWDAAPCTGNTPGWVDSLGFGCDWFEIVDSPGCPVWGDSFEGAMGVANDNCCYCFGTGAPAAPSTPEPAYAPWSWTPSPTLSPCTGNTPGWADIDGDGCKFYELFDEPGCPAFGDYSEGTMGVANDNCCYCFGTGAPTPSPCTGSTPHPTTCGCDEGKQADYRGDIAVTASGYACQAWDAQAPHEHTRTPENYPDAGLGGHNHCRNPDGNDSAWCYTTDPGLRWDFCAVPWCPAEGDLATVDPTPSPTEDTLASLKPTTSPTEDDLATPEPLATVDPTPSPTENTLASLKPTTNPEEDDLATPEPTSSPTQDAASSASEDQSNNTESIFSPIKSGETAASNSTSIVESISSGSNLNYALFSWFSVFAPFVWVLA